MLLVVPGKDVKKHERIMNSLFRLRYDTFVIGRQWSLPCKNGLDIDQYDNEHAIYFILCDEGENILASVRMHRTSQASLLADYFPSLVESGQLIRDDTVYEGTRYFFTPKAAGPRSVRRVLADLNCGAVEWMRAHGGLQSQAVVDYGAFQLFTEMTRHARPLGLPQDYGGGPTVKGGGRCIAFSWNLNDELMADFRAYGASRPLKSAGGQLHPIN